MELKKHQAPMSIDEQVENLKELGLVINNEEEVKEFLNDVSYFRLIKGYSIGLYREYKRCISDEYDGFAV